MKKLISRLRSSHSPSESGINMVDLMMWLVIAALLLAAALQGIGFYQRAAYLHNMKTEIDGVAANAHAAASMNGGSMDDAILAAVIADNNAKHNTDSITITYGMMMATAAGPVGDNASGVDRVSSVSTATSPNVYYLKATSTLVDSRYVVYFFEDTASFSKGISDVPKNRIDAGGTDAAIVPGATASPSPTASPTATSTPTTTPAPTATPTPTPTVVKSAIDLKYDAVNGPVLLGAPNSAETDMAGGGRYRSYANGLIIWSPANGAFTSLNGPIRTKYVEIGANRLGFPTSDDQQAMPSGGGKQQTYSNGGAIVWSAATGAHISTGGIRSRWLAGNAQAGRMGFPTSGEIALATGSGFKQTYQGGAIYWSPSTGGWEMGGAFYTTWLNYGAESGVYGYPTSNERWLDGNTIRQDFQNGHYFLWNNSAGTVTRY